MGASGWDYVVPYEADLDSALQKLRQSVFETDRYFRLQRDAPKPSSIDELRQQNEDAGTHSILDIDRISGQPEFGAAAPLTDEELVQLLGVTQPIAEIVHANLDKIMDFRRRWRATYVIIYEDGKPHEILFTGFSGD